MRAPRPSASESGPRAEIAARRLALLAADLAADRDGAVQPVSQSDRSHEDAEQTEGPGRAAEEVPAWWMDHTRVRPAAPSSSPAASPSVPPVPSSRSVVEASTRPPTIPEPGRHAARRRSTPPRPGILDQFDRMPRWRPVHLSVVAIVVACGLAATSWWVTRDRPQQIAPVAVGDASSLVDGLAAATQAPVGAPSGTQDPSAPSGTGEVGEVGAEVTVDVAGDVRRPGIVVLPEGSRVVDAVDAAGGARQGVDLSTINLARLLVDGEQILVGEAAVGVPLPPVDPGAAPSDPAGPTTLVNLNTATAVQLEELPEVGPVTAGAIVLWRDEHGGFTSVDELLEVDGIGDKTLETIRPHVTV